MKTRNLLIKRVLDVRIVRLSPVLVASLGQQPKLTLFDI